MAIISIESLFEPTPLVKPRAVGIDLGTTHSLVSLDIEGEVRVLADENGGVLLPSVVQYTLDDAIVGETAKAGLVDDPQNTFQSIKRHMGSDVVFTTAHGKRSPIEISADILNQLMLRVRAIEGSITDAVITVPAYFDDAQRQATKQAAHLAGLNVLRLINEPTAAAVAYGLDQLAQGKCLVFDLGGGTFDVSLLNITQGVIAVLATSGDTALGGDDMDSLLINWIKYHLSTDDISEGELRAKARLAKEALSESSTASIALSNQVTLNISRSEFEAIIKPLVHRMLKICQRVLYDANIESSLLDAVILVGGATKIPYIQQELGAFMGQAPRCERDPSTVVALGAGLQASVLSGHRRQSQLLLDVIPLSLGLEMMGGVVEKILPRNTPIPASITESFTTYADNQTGLLLHIVQGERELAKDCRSLGRFELSGIPPMPAGKARLEVTYQIDCDGLLTVSAKEVTTQQQTSLIVKPTYGLAETDVMREIENAIEHASDDVKIKKQLKKQQEIDTQLRMQERIQRALAGKSVDELEKTVI